MSRSIKDCRSCRRVPCKCSLRRHLSCFLFHTLSRLGRQCAFGRHAGYRVGPSIGTPVPGSFNLQLFQWNGELPAGQHFDQIITPAGYIADTSHLYTDGYITLTAVPEPARLVLAAFGGLALLAWRWRSTTQLRAARSGACNEPCVESMASPIERHRQLRRAACPPLARLVPRRR